MELHENLTDEYVSEMSAREFELYLYSLRKMAESNLESNRSFMTGLYNRRAFEYKAGEEMLDNPDLQFALIMLDFANFKSINEFCGRKAGDELLRCTADALRKEVREHVVLSHFRADIFAILTPFTEREELVEIAMRIDKEIVQLEIPYKVLPAFGICVAEHYTTSINVMCDYATMALNSIKGKFYDKYAFFDDNMRNSMLLHKMIENDIVSALKEKQLCPYIQPKVDMVTGEIIGGEALVRWIHPRYGLVPPNQFIPLVEKNGLIIDVDNCVWKQVFAFLGKRIAEGKKVVPISINISRMHVFDKAFRTRLLTLAAEYQVPPWYVLMELTESGFLENSEDMYEHMEFFRNQGFALSMDDFGTGYSTMTMLKNRPVDEIKIDKGFIDDISNAKSRSIVKHTIEMLQDLDVDIIVEGVETKEQQDFLLECGCRNAQGFFYYKPMPMTEFETLLDQERNKKDKEV
jgi:diguanylate cyclase (GGDEF)-like protein